MFCNEKHCFVRFIKWDILDRSIGIGLIFHGNSYYYPIIISSKEEGSFDPNFFLSEFVNLIQIGFFDGCRAPYAQKFVYSFIGKFFVNRSLKFYQGWGESSYLGAVLLEVLILFLNSSN